jgi:hypothetical protein
MNPDKKWFYSFALGSFIILSLILLTTKLYSPILFDKTEKIIAAQQLRNVYNEWIDSNRTEDFDLSKYNVGTAFEIRLHTNTFELGESKVKAAFIYKSSRFAQPIEIIVSDEGEFYQHHPEMGFEVFEVPSK